MPSLSRTYNEIQCSPSTTAVTAMISLVLPFAMVAMGTIHMDNCPAEKYIPIYLIVGGSFTILVVAVRVLVKICCSGEGNTFLFDLISIIINLVLGLFMFAWFIAGSVWIYGLHTKYDPTDKTAANYCDNTFYLFAFWCTTASYILIAVMVFIACCCCRK
ncbi:transmembrane protein 272-like isoform X1 [Haliotis rufescens]|uniref:transmembrane protein 272-like isoform X1 n=1 Tax=Haliotis rufescens TaxID=6454 RepID=UPI001EB03A6B|nr:transmembrane protein 272-like isoform X1 [Haliotis rufescens]XP_046374189.1 transmembrane protein 272-like isoform X1 [Haliotis rufescens]XP_046374190.1 transmembrane protein 272-like isoform X1 [Haliotis rufescens]